jgi:myosin heavy subunit
LDATKPHFVRCIIPNEIKTGGILDAHLVMHQLHCNGVLEGIRICRKGYPSRLLFKEFLARYGIIAAEQVKKISDPKKASAAVLEEIKLDSELYRVGLTNVLFKAGVLGTLEELRDAAISKILTMLQSHIRTYLMKKNIQSLIDQKKSIGTLQRNIKAYLVLRNWGWFKLFGHVKPLLNNAKKLPTFITKNYKVK